MGSKRSCQVSNQYCFRLNFGPVENALIVSSLGRDCCAISSIVTSPSSRSSKSSQFTNDHPPG